MKTLKLRKSERTDIRIKESYSDKEGNLTVLYHVFNSGYMCGKGFITFYNTKEGNKARADFFKRYNHEI